MVVRRKATFWIIGASVIVACVVIRLLPELAPDSDLALIDLSVLRVLTGWQPVGAYSRLGWSHPGPLFFQMLAPLYAATGYRHLSILLSVTAIGGASLLGIAAVLRRHSPAMLIAAVCLLGVYLARLNGLLASAWNPYVPLLPLALLAFSAAAAAAGTYRLLPLVVGLASFVVQTHAGFLPPVMTIVGTAAIIVAADVLSVWRRDRRVDPALGRGLVTALIVSCLLWAVPLIDELRPNGQHNLARIASFVLHATPANPRLSERLFDRFAIAPFTPRLKLWGDEPVDVPSPVIQLVVQVEALALVGTLAVFFRHGLRFERNTALIALASSVVALIAARRLPERPQEYVLFWVTILGVLNWTVIATALVEVVAKWRPSGRGLISMTTSGSVRTVIIAGLVLLCVRDIAAFRAAELPGSSVVQRLTALVRAKIESAASSEPLVIVPPAFWGVATGVVLQLRRGGFSPHVDGAWSHVFGADCAETGRETVTVAFARSDEHMEDFRYRREYEPLGSADDVFVYAVHAIPASVAAKTPLRIVDHSGFVQDSARLVDGQIATHQSDRSSQAVVFADDDEFATIEMPHEPVIGVRLWGQGGSTWQLRCGAGTDFTRIGRVRIDDGDDAQRGVAYLWNLERCQQFKISPAPSQGAAWLVEVQLLVSVPR